MKNTSLFIPFVFPNFDKEYVSKAFAKIGEVDRVDFVAKQDRNGKTYNAVYIHFKKWYDNYDAIETLCRLETSGKTELYHDDSDYFWIVLPNTAKKHIPGDRKPRLDLGSSNSINIKTVENMPEKKPFAKIVIKRDNMPEKKPFAKLIAKTDNTPATIYPPEFDAEFEEYLELLRSPVEEWETEEEAQMAEIEAELEAEDANLISIDYRYVQSVEQENVYLREEIAQLRMALINLDEMYKAEKAKVTAFSDVGTSVDL